MVHTLPAVPIGQRLIADARNSATNRAENMQEVDKFLKELESVGSPSLANLENMSLDLILLCLTSIIHLQACTERHVFSTSPVGID